MATEDIGDLIITQIPDLVEDANIQTALRIYHYGTDSASAETETNINNIPQNSIARRLHNLRTDVDAANAGLLTRIGASTFNAKGDLLVGTANDAYQVLTAGVNGKVLVANSGQTTGLEWQDFPTSFNNLTATTLNVTGNAVFHIAIVPKTGSYTPASGDISDDGKLLEFNNSTGSPIYFNIPENSTNPYPIGTQISILRTNTGEVVVQGVNANVTVNATPGRALRVQWSSATAIKRGTNSWVLIGDLKVG